MKNTCDFSNILSHVDLNMPLFQNRYLNMPDVYSFPLKDLFHSPKGKLYKRAITKVLTVDASVFFRD